MFRFSILALLALQQRVNELKRDGYWEMFRAEGYHTYVVKLRHRNGKIVYLSLNNRDNTLEQRTNGRCVRKDKVC